MRRCGRWTVVVYSDHLCSDSLNHFLLSRPSITAAEPPFLATFLVYVESVEGIRSDSITYSLPVFPVVYFSALLLLEILLGVGQTGSSVRLLHKSHLSCGTATRMARSFGHIPQARRRRYILYDLTRPDGDSLNRQQTAYSIAKESNLTNGLCPRLITISIHFHRIIIVMAQILCSSLLPFRRAVCLLNPFPYGGALCRVLMVVRISQLGKAIKMRFSSRVGH